MNVNFVFSGILDHYRSGDEILSADKAFVMLKMPIMSVYR
jgi:hypothetical protein